MRFVELKIWKRTSKWILSLMFQTPSFAIRCLFLADLTFVGSDPKGKSLINLVGTI